MLKKGLALAMGCLILAPSVAMAKTTLSVWMWNKEILIAVEAFKKKYPDIDVKASVMDWNTFHDKLLTSIVAGTGVPDVTGIEINYMPRFVGSNLLTNLDSYGAQKHKDNFVDFRWRLATQKGKVYALPIDVGPVATWYRPVTLADSGFPSDQASVASSLKKWEDLFTISKKLVRDTNGDGKLDYFSIASGKRIAQLMRLQLGGRVFDEDLKVVMDTEDSDKWNAAWKLGKQFKDSGYESGLGQRWDSPFQRALKSNKMAFLMEAVWNGVWVKPLGGQWGVVPLPTGVGANEGGSFLAIPQAAKHKKEAYKFAEFVTTTTSAQVDLMEKAYWFPAYKPSYSDSYFQEPAAWCSNQKWLQTFAQAAMSTTYIPVTRHEDKANTIVDEELNRVWNGKDVKTAVRDAATNIRRASRGAK